MKKKRFLGSHGLINKGGGGYSGQRGSGVTVNPMKEKNEMKGGNFWERGDADCRNESAIDLLINATSRLSRLTTDLPDNAIRQISKL